MGADTARIGLQSDWSLGGECSPGYNCIMVGNWGGERLGAGRLGEDTAQNRSAFWLVAGVGRG